MLFSKFRPMRHRCNYRYRRDWWTRPCRTSAPGYRRSRCPRTCHCCRSWSRAEVYKGKVKSIVQLVLLLKLCRAKKVCSTYRNLTETELNNLRIRLKLATLLKSSYLKSNKNSGKTKLSRKALRLNLKGLKNLWKPRSSRWPQLQSSAQPWRSSWRWGATLTSCASREKRLITNDFSNVQRLGIIVPNKERLSIWLDSLFYADIWLILPRTTTAAAAKASTAETNCFLISLSFTSSTSLITSLCPWKLGWRMCPRSSITRRSALFL